MLRRPNRRYKASKAVLRQRLRAMWRNNIAVRCAAEELLGRDLDIYGIDEKGIHMNEMGSRGVGTLALQGSPAVALKVNHAATRERVSLMTTVTSSRTAALQPKRLPIEVLFKAKTQHVLKALRVPKNCNMSTAFGPKGSYRADTIMQFLKRYLDPWTPEREASADYRILYYDVAKSHLDEAIDAFAWKRGYVVLLHYGCTTGIGQVNDTDCHAEFSRVYTDMETISFQEKQEIDPSDISRSRQEVLRVGWCGL